MWTKATASSCTATPPCSLRDYQSVARGRESSFNIFLSFVVELVSCQTFLHRLLGRHMLALLLGLGHPRSDALRVLLLLVRRRAALFCAARV